MNRIAALARALPLILLFSISHFLQSQKAPTTTVECGPINSDATWTLANSPYEVCGTTGVSVVSGATLTIEPGVTVQFQNSNSAKLNIGGALIAKGTRDQPVTFTGVVANAGSWGGISADGPVGAPAVVDLDNAVLDYAGAVNSAGFDAYNADVTIARSAIHNSLGSGFRANFNAHFELHDTSFDNNAQDAILLNTPSVDLLMADLSASGNGKDGIHIIGTTTWPGQRRWSNPGIPYYVDGQMSNSPGDVLTIDPGNELRFGTNSFFNIGGELKVEGTSDAPILMTGQAQTSGSWRGIYANGFNHQAVIQLDYTTVEYAGSELANIELQDGQLIAHHSVIRDSLKDGVRFESNTIGSILNSQIYGNTLYGIIITDPNVTVLATNDWWGDPGGPRSDIAGCSSGLGDKVSAGVLYIPVLTSANASVDLPLSAYPNLTLTPERWFAPADGTTRVYFDITLRDGNGAPIPGRVVKLKSSLGNVVDGGKTDALGKTLAWLTSTTTGDADVHARLDALTACEGALSPDSQVTFTTPITGVDLMPNRASDYQNNDITVSPLPVLTGVNTTITARLTNPLTQTVTADVEFDFVQAGIGLVFGPINTYKDQVIPPNSSVTLSASFVPSVAGHYCVQVSYNITMIGTQKVTLQAAGPDPGNPLNLNVYQSTTGSGDKGAKLEKTRKSLKAVNMFVDRTYDTKPIAIPLAIANQGIAWDLNTAEKISNALDGDPPRQDYTVIDTPHVLELPPTQAGDGISAARAAALNALDDALAQANAYGTAAAIAFDRSGGAAEAGDLDWESTQTAVMLEYNQLFGTELITASLKIQDLINVAASEGVTSVPISVSDVITMQQKLATSGFSQQEKDDAHAVGLSDADIEQIRQNIVSANPEDLAGDVIANMQQISEDLYSLGQVLAHPAVFAPGYHVGGIGLMQQQTAGNTMAQVYDTLATIPLYNPNAITTTVTLRSRRVDLPADWAVDVSPAQVTLGPHELTDVTVRVEAGSPLAQGSTPRVAVEGYIGNQLLGGVTIQTVVPGYRFFDGNLRVYLPVVKR